MIPLFHVTQVGHQSTLKVTHEKCCSQRGGKNISCKTSVVWWKSASLWNSIIIFTLVSLVVVVHVMSWHTWNMASLSTSPIHENRHTMRTIYNHNKNKIL